MKVLFSNPKTCRLKAEALSRVSPSSSFWLLASGSWLLFLTGCAPTVHLNTPEPLKVDISMKIDVYQRGELGGSAQRKYTEEESKALRRRDDRSGEIWAMKNDAVAVEGKQGYLEAQIKSGWEAAHVNQLLAEENRDRRVGYEAEAQASARPITVIEQEAGKRLRQQAYGRKPEAKPETNPKQP